MNPYQTIISVVACLWAGASTPTAQYGEYGNNTTTTPEQQTAIDQATGFLDHVGVDTSGYSISAADLTGTTPASSNPATGDIGIDFERIDEVIDGADGAEGTPAVIAIIIFHETQHLQHGWGRSTCQDLELAAYVATHHCELIHIIASNGLGPIDALCKVYDHVRMKASSGDPGNCSGNTYIAPCPDCSQ